MDSLIGLIEQIHITDFEIDTSHWVTVTHINHPHSFYVRFNTLSPYLSTLEARSEHLMASQIHEGKQVIYKSKVAKNYIRGVIVSINSINQGSECSIRAMDYGFTEEGVALGEFYSPLNDFNVPPLIQHCQLYECEPLDGKEFSKDAVDAMKFFVGNERAKMIIKCKHTDKIVVELINTCPDDIAQMLALNGYTSFGYNNSSCESNTVSMTLTKRQYLIYKQLNDNDTLRVRVQSGTDLKRFYVADVDEYKEFQTEIYKNFRYFSKQEEKLDPSEIIEGLPVSVMDSAAHFKRAVVKRITVYNKMVLVQFIDSGIQQEVYISWLRKMSDKFLYVPALAIFCSLEDTQTLDSRLDGCLYPGFQFYITIKKVGDKFNTPNIVNIFPVD